MRTKLQFLAIMFVWTACGGAKSSADESQTVQMKDQAVRQIQEERRAAPVRPSDQTDVAEPAGEELAVQMFELDTDRPARAESGLIVRMTSAGPEWAFELDHHGRKQSAAFSGEPLYIEGVAFGHLYVISQLGSSVQLTLRSDSPAQPLEARDAFAAARRERSARLGCDGSREETAVLDNGTAVLRVLDADGVESCRIVVGRFTREVIDP